MFIENMIDNVYDCDNNIRSYIHMIQTDVYKNMCDKLTNHEPAFNLPIQLIKNAF